MISILALRARIARGELSAEDAVRRALDAIAEKEEAIGAFVTLDREGALAAARTATGPLAGIAVGVKDTIDTADMPTEIGSPIYRGWRPKADAALVMMIRGAGASIVGKTTTTAFAHSDPTATRNPHNAAFSPGGSSAGSAAAVAAGMVPLSFGSQTGGSMIRPASYNGVAAMKPSYRLLPTAGLKPYSVSIDTLGLFAATVPDVAFALSAITRRDFAPLGRKPRIGVTRQTFAGPPAPECEAALHKAIGALSAQGIAVTDLADPPEFATAWELHPLLADMEALDALAWEWKTQRPLMPPKLSKALQWAETSSIAQFDDARHAGKRARIAAHDFFKEIDAVISYSAPGTAPALSENATGHAAYNRLWSLLGTPCINVPGCRAPNGMPVGVQVIARFGQDATALSVAAMLEAALRT